MNRKYEFEPSMLCGLPRFSQLLLFHDDGEKELTSPFCKIYLRTGPAVALAVIQSSLGNVLGTGFITRGTLGESLATQTVWLHTGKPYFEEPEKQEWIETGLRIERIQITEETDEARERRISIVVFTVEGSYKTAEEVVHTIDFKERSFTNGRGWTLRDGQQMEC